jgi:hypothetical protein
MHYIIEHTVKIDFKVRQYGCLPSKTAEENTHFFFVQLLIEVISTKLLKFVAEKRERMPNPNCSAQQPG